MLCVLILIALFSLYCLLNDGNLSVKHCSSTAVFRFALWCSCSQGDCERVQCGGSAGRVCGAALLLLHLQPTVQAEHHLDPGTFLQPRDSSTGLNVHMQNIHIHTNNSSSSGKKYWLLQPPKSTARVIKINGNFLKLYYSVLLAAFKCFGVSVGGTIEPHVDIFSSFYEIVCQFWPACFKFWNLCSGQNFGGNRMTCSFPVLRSPWSVSSNR